jgi:DNA-directed RNA polymerase subunit beta
LALVKSKRISFASAQIKADILIFSISNSNPFRIFFSWKPILKTGLTKAFLKFLVKTFRSQMHATISSSSSSITLLTHPATPLKNALKEALTYSVPLKAKLKLYCTDPEHEDFETIIQDVYLGMIPYMTPRGTLSSTAPNVLLYHSCTAHPVYFSAPHSMPTDSSCILPVLSRLRDRGWNLQPTSTM